MQLTETWILCYHLSQCRVLSTNITCHCLHQCPPRGWAEPVVIVILAHPFVQDVKQTLSWITGMGYRYSFDDRGCYAKSCTKFFPNSTKISSNCSPYILKVTIILIEKATFQYYTKISAELMSYQEQHC